MTAHPRPKPLPRWFAAANARRSVLVCRKAGRRLTAAEAADLAGLTAKVTAAVKAAYPGWWDKLDGRERESVRVVGPKAPHGSRQRR